MRMSLLFLIALCALVAFQGIGQTVLSFLVALGILITFHEFGHFWVARKVGVKVLRFSIGFGQPLWRYQRDPASTEFVVAGIPLGGYVKMVDEREGEVHPDDLPYAFNRQALWARSAIVLAGPVFNLMLAVLIYWAVSVSGEVGLKPVLGPVATDTFASDAGFMRDDEILTVADRDTPTWQIAMTQLVSEVLDRESVRVRVKTADESIVERRLRTPGASAMKPEELYQHLGFTPWEPVLEPVVGRVEADSPAERAGLRSADRVLKANGKAIQTWHEWVALIRAHPGALMPIEVERDGVLVSLTLQPETRESEAGPFGRIGAGVEVPPGLLDGMRVEYRLGVFEGLLEALQKTCDYSVLTVKMMGRMLVGQASIENLSGPISIAKHAGEAAKMGLMSFVKLLAVISVSLGVLNLFPIPMLDGGHLLYFLVEAIKGSPVSEQAQFLWQYVGLTVLLSLMALAVFLDLERHVF